MSMTIDMLIDAVVRQTTVLIAHLATASGNRAPLAHLANELFLSLTRELKTQGVGNKVVADMFGMLLRSYHKKVRRLAESSSMRGQSLWSAVYDFLRARAHTTRAEVMQRFAYDDEEVVRSILHDLTDSGLVSVAGRGPSALYQPVPEAYLRSKETPQDPLEDLLAVAVYQIGPASMDALAERLGTRPERIASALERLAASGQIRRVEADGSPQYTADTYCIPFRSAIGWEAAVFDHYQALVTTVIHRLETMRTGGDPDGVIGGSTYAFDLWPDHPMENAVLSHLKATRQTLSDLRSAIDEYNASLDAPPREQYRVTIYHGQNLIQDREPPA